MKRFLVRTLLSALAFMYVLPLIPGIDFHGNFGIALVAALLFALLALLIDILALTVSAAWTMSTLGLALIVLVPLWLIGYWVVPAITLELVSHCIPTHLNVDGWLPALGGGLVMLIIGIATSSPSGEQARLRKRNA